MTTASLNRPLTAAEDQLIRWMLLHGKPEAKEFLPQLEKAQVTPWCCGCGCASFNISIEGCFTPIGRIHPIANFTFGSEEDLNGIFLYEIGGVLSGLEVYGLSGDASKILPSPESLCPFSKSA